MINKFNLSDYTKKLVEKFSALNIDTTNVIKYEDETISDCITKATQNDLIHNSSDASLYITYVLYQGRPYYRLLYQIKTSVNGKIKNIDSVISLIKEFEHEFTFADKVFVTPEAGVIYVDILKKNF